MYIPEERPQPGNFKKIIMDHVKEPEGVIICSFFGCGTKLTLQEKRCGDYCINHLGGKRNIDPMLIVKRP